MSTRTEVAPVPVPQPGPPLSIGPAHDEQFTRELLAAMVEFRDGNFDVRMPRDLTGVAGKLADVFNEVVSVSSQHA